MILNSFKTLLKNPGLVTASLSKIVIAFHLAISPGLIVSTLTIWWMCFVAAVVIASILAVVSKTIQSLMAVLINPLILLGG